MAKRTPTDSLKAARELVRGLQAGTPAESRTLAAILELLDEVEKGLRREDRPIRRRGGTGIRYRVEEVGGRTVLSEFRTAGTSKPFRISEEIVDAVVGVLAAAERPLLFDDIMERVAAQVEPRPADFQVRTVLRFLLKDGGLIRRERQRHTRVKELGTVTKFKQAVKTVWNSLRK